MLIGAFENYDVNLVMDEGEFDVDFDTSSGLDGFTGFLLPAASVNDVGFLRDLYNKNRLDVTPAEDTEKIPKIIHQVWIGENEIPNLYQKYRSNWKKYHPEWEFVLWTDKEVDGFDFDTKDIYLGASSIGQKIDVLRAEILKEFGGLYVDMDYDCFRPLDIFHHRYDFYSTLRAFPFLYLWWKKLYVSPLRVCPSLLGAHSNHPILESFLSAVRITWEENLVDEEHNQPSMPMLGKLRNKARLETIRSAIKVTYNPFHDCVIKEAGKYGSVDIVLPPTFFNPIDTWVEINPLLFLDYWMYMIRNRFSHRSYSTSVKSHSFTHHDSTGDWI